MNNPDTENFSQIGEFGSTTEHDWREWREQFDDEQAQESMSSVAEGSSSQNQQLAHHEPTSFLAHQFLYNVPSRQQLQQMQMETEGTDQGTQELETMMQEGIDAYVAAQQQQAPEQWPMPMWVQSQQAREARQAQAQTRAREEREARQAQAQTRAREEREARQAQGRRTKTKKSHEFKTTNQHRKRYYPKGWQPQ